MDYNLENQTEVYLFDEQVRYFRNNKKLVSIEEIKHTRTNAQNRARWLYLQMCSDILNERGETFRPIGLKIDVAFTKDNLYEMYWQTMKKHLYPGKSKQLDTKEFSNLVEMVLMLFAKVFDISIPFPSWQEIEFENEQI